MADVALEFHDGPHATPPPADSGPIYLGIKNLTEAGTLDLSTVRHISAEDFPRWTKRVTPQPGDLVFTYEATLHRYALIPEGFEGCLGRRLALIRPRLDVVDPKFLLLTMLSPRWRNVVEERIITGATVDRIPLIDFPNFPIRLPALTTQRRVAAALSAFDELIEINKQRIEVLDNLAHSLYREWFVHFRFPGHEDIELVESELGPIPEGWEVCPLDDVAAVNRKSVEPVNIPDPFLYLDISAVGVGGVEAPSLLPATGAPGRARRLASDGDIVWATVRPNRRAHAQIHNPPSNLIVSTGLAVLSPVTVPPSFLFEYTASDAFSSYLVGRATGSAYPAVRPKDFSNAPVAVPPRSLLESFDAIVDPIQRLRSDLRQQNHQLAATRDLLLPRLITGQLDISGIDLGALTPAGVE